MHPTPSDQPKLTRKHRLLLRIERFSREHYKLVFLLGALALIGGTFLGSRLKLESDLLALIPQGNRQVDTFRQALQDFGSVHHYPYEIGGRPQFSWPSWIPITFESMILCAAFTCGLSMFARAVAAWIEAR